jgi:hypothetical protein
MQERVPVTTAPVATTIWNGKVITLELDMTQLEGAEVGDEIRAQVQFIRKVRGRASSVPSPTQPGAPARV